MSEPNASRRDENAEDRKVSPFVRFTANYPPPAGLTVGSVYTVEVRIHEKPRDATGVPAYLVSDSNEDWDILLTQSGGSYGRTTRFSFTMPAVDRSGATTSGRKYTLQVSNTTGQSDSWLELLVSGAIPDDDKQCKGAPPEGK